MFDDDNDQGFRDIGQSRGNNIGKDGLTTNSAVKAAIFVALLLVCVIIIYTLIIGPAGGNQDDPPQNNNGGAGQTTNGDGNNNGTETNGNGTETPDPDPTPTPNPNFPLRQGDEDKEEIRELQTMLRTKGYLDITEEQIGTTFGQRTYEAVRRFQEEHYLSITGIVDEELFELISEAETRIDIGPGQSSPRVRELQGLLIERGYLDLAMDARTEIFGPATQAAVEAFQRAHNLPVRNRVTNALIARVEAAEPRGD